MRGPVAAAESESVREAVAIAPRWHTGLLVGLIVAVALAGAWMQRGGVAVGPARGDGHRVVDTYVPMLLAQWGMVAYVGWVARPRGALASLLGARWNTVRRAATDLALAAAGWIAITSVEIAASHFAATTAAPALLPGTAGERVAWVLVAASAGFCEEVVYRGYLQTQFRAWSGRASVAVVLQAVLFGLAHGDQGVGVALRAMAYGLGFGALASWRKSLWPGIACHAWTDLASGLLRV